jgi:hypothetical protein
LVAEFFITRENLILEGWKKVGKFGIYEIWAKEDNRILFVKTQNYIYLTYKFKEKAHESKK